MNHDDSSIENYYRKRAPVYDAVYAYPERQADLRFLEKYVHEQFSGLDVLEVAAGTGYWTQYIGGRANSVVATDAVAEALTQIEKRTISKAVQIRQADAYELADLGMEFNGAFAGLWLSHVPKQRLGEFFQSLHRVLAPGATVLFIDNSRAQLERLPLSYADEFGNTFQDRELEDGSTHRVLKNFPTADELEAAIERHGIRPIFKQLENFWLFQYTAK